MKARYIVLRPPIVVVTLLLLAACASESQEDSTTVPSPVASVIEVTFDGTRCAVDGELSRPVGDQVFILTNHSDLIGVDLLVGSLSDGHVFQDLVDIQAEEGGAPAYVEQPDWLVFEYYAFNPESAPDIDLVEGQDMSVFLLTEGYDAIWLATYVPLRLWFCAPLEVTPL